MTARFQFGIASTFIISGFLPIAGSFFVLRLFGWDRTHEPLHSAIEATGALIALTVAVLLLQMRGGQEFAHFTWIASALIGMGILDGFHSVLHVGGGFVRTHSMATLVGGLLFCLIWLPDHLARTRLAKALPGFVAVAATILGLLIATFPDELPAMLSGDGFTPVAKAVNFFGGMFFIAAGICFLLRYQARGRKDDLLFANQCLLFGGAGVLFANSTLWNASWWYWHLLRLVAYLVVFGYAFSVYHRLQEQLRGSEARSRALLHAIPDLIFRYHLDGTLLDFQVHNGSLNFKTPPEMMIGANIHDAPMQGEVIEQIMAASRQAVETGEVQTFEFAYPKAADLRHYETRIVTSGTNELVALVRNITRRKQTVNELRRSREELRVLTGRLISAKEEESRHLARELHDVFSQKLAVLGMEISALQQECAALPSSLTDRLRWMGDEIGRLAQDVHQLSRLLHPSILDDLGLSATLRAECAAFSKQHGIPAEFASHNVPESLPSDISLGLYRIAQESLWNAAKHAEAKEIRVTLTGAGQEIVLAIDDDGNGFDLEQVRGKGGLGLVSIEERVRLVNGRLSVTSAPGKGTSVEVRIPLSGN
ncbi:MAG: sensor histidine kinase [Acidobacteria bacterium]|nr:sensor histidine kinase [Acidobacteriota bacterium]